MFYTNKSQKPAWVSWFSRLASFLVLAVLALTLGAISPLTPPQRLHSALAALAARDPAAPVAVIVQKLVPDNSVEARVTALGGTITKDLHIINAFAAELPAQDAVALAEHPAVRWISLDAPVEKQGMGDSSSTISTANLVNTYIYAIAADKVWNTSPYLQGQGVTVALVDSGLDSSAPTQFTESDFSGTGNMGASTSRIKNQSTNHRASTPSDQYGHGTHVAGIIGGNGAMRNGKYIGVAPKVNLATVKVTDDQGMATESDVVQGLQWVYDNRATYNIKVVNLSLNATVAQSYHTSPLDAAMEILWFNKIVVVVSGGNNGLAQPGIVYPPANDPFVITVGAADDRGTQDVNDDEMTAFSAYGTTMDDFVKPDILAPGRNIVSVLANANSTFAKEHADRIVDRHYFRMSGTSTAAPIVAGAVALLLQDEPGLTPDQVKYRLTHTPSRLISPAGSSASFPYLNVYNAVRGTTTQSANTGLQASQLLWTGSQSVTWGSVNWNSVNWNSVNWNSVNWNSVNWNSVNWNSDYWGP